MLREAGVVPVFSGQLVLIKSADEQRWVLPKGPLKGGELYSSAALRIAKEKAGLDGVLLSHIWPYYTFEHEGEEARVVYFPMVVTSVKKGDRLIIDKEGALGLLAWDPKLQAIAALGWRAI